MIIKKIIHDKLTISYILLVICLLLHITGEAVNGFLDFYNPLVLKLREYSSIFPFPTFSFKIGLQVLHCCWGNKLVTVCIRLCPG